MAMRLGTAELEDAPVFEVRHTDGRHFRIWADGRIDGFGNGAIVLNRIHAGTNKAIAQARALQPA